MGECSSYILTPGRALPCQYLVQDDLKSFDHRLEFRPSTVVKMLTTDGLDDGGCVAARHSEVRDCTEECFAVHCRGFRLRCFARSGAKLTSQHTLRSYVRPSCQAAVRARPISRRSVSRPASPSAASSARSKLLGRRTGRHRLPNSGAK